MNKAEFLKIYLLQIFSTTFGMSVFSFILLFFYKQGASLMILLLGELCFYALAIFIFLFKRRFFTKKSLQTSILINFIIITLLILTNKLYFLFPIEIIRGLGMICYWVPFNFLYFKLASDRNRATHAAWMVVIGSVVGAFVPLLAGLIITYYNYDILFVIGGILNLIMFLFINKIKSENHFFSLQKSLLSLKKIKALLFLEGTMHTILITLIPLMSLNFITKEDEWGMFFAYLSLVGAVAAIIFAFISDKYKIRRGFSIPISTILAVSIISLYFANNFWLWSVFVGVFYIVINLFFPFTAALVLDTNKNHLLGWAGREFIFNCARVLIVILAILCLALNNFSIIFLIAGLILLSYPVVLLRRKIY